MKMPSQVPAVAPSDRSRTSEIENVLRSLGRRQMALPALLFLAGHRPLAFVCGQLLYVAAPMANLAGWQGCQDWAALLSQPDGPARLEQILERSIQQVD